MPVDALVDAIRQLQAAVVVISHRGASRRSAVDALRAAAKALPPTNHIFYAGSAFQTSRSRTDMPGVYLGDSLSDAADLIHQTTRNDTG